MRKIAGGLLIILLLVSTAMASGTNAGATILSASTNAILTYADGFGSTTTKSAADDLIPDDEQLVITINGMVETNVDIASIGAETGGVYPGLLPGTDYALSHTYLNRGNATDMLHFAASLEQLASRWTISGATSENQAVIEDQIQTFVITVNPTSALNFERATLNVDASIYDYGSKNIVSYNAFANAVSSEIYDGAYGGIAAVNHMYVLEAAGASLNILARMVEIESPASYQAAGGGATDVVPGAKLRYSIVVENDSGIMAIEVNISDVIPANCHLYYDDAPTVEGASFVWTGSTDNNTATTVNFQLDIPANSTVTASYSVTID